MRPLGLRHGGQECAPIAERELRTESDVSLFGGFSSTRVLLVYCFVSQLITQPGLKIHVSWDVNAVSICTWLPTLRKIFIASSGSKRSS